MGAFKLFRGLMVFGCFLAIFKYIKAEHSIFKLAANSNADPFQLSQQYTQLKRSQDRIRYGYELSFQQDEALNRLRVSDISEKVIQAIFIGKHMSRDGKVFFYPKIETALFLLCAIVAILGVAFIAKVGVEILIIEGYSWTVKFAVFFSIVGVVGIPLYSLYNLAIKSFFIFFQSRKVVDPKTI